MKDIPLVITPKTMRDHQVTLRVVYKVKYHWRVRLAMALLKLAGRIGGIAIQDDSLDVSNTL